MTRLTKLLILCLILASVLACGVKLPVTGDNDNTAILANTAPYGSEPLAWTPQPTMTAVPSFDGEKPSSVLSEER